jgi:hypothetical protein
MSSKESTATPGRVSAAILDQASPLQDRAPDRLQQRASLGVDLFAGVVSFIERQRG